MTSQVLFLKSIAGSGTDSVTYALPTGAVGSGARSLDFKVAGNFGAASSAGLSTVITLSYDGGSTFVASNFVFPLLTAGATGEVEAEAVYHRADNPYIVDQGNPTHIKLSFTNNDSAHACLTAVMVENLVTAAAR